MSTISSEVLPEKRYTEIKKTENICLSLSLPYIDRMGKSAIVKTVVKKYYYINKVQILKNSEKMSSTI